MLKLSSIQTVMLMLTHFLKLRLNLTPTVMLMLTHFQMLKLSSTQTEMLKLMHFLKLRLNLTLTVMRSLMHLLRHFQKDFLKQERNYPPGEKSLSHRASRTGYFLLLPPDPEK